MSKNVLLIGMLDTKGAEYKYLQSQIEELGASTQVINLGVFSSSEQFDLLADAEEVAVLAGTTLSELQKKNDRGIAMQAMADGSAKLVRGLYDEGKFDAIIGMGGTGGTSVITSAMRALPYGVPKLCVSTIASGDTSNYVDVKDIVLFPSLVDVAGLNRILKMVLDSAARAICGMVQGSDNYKSDGKRTIAATMFGNTTACVDACRIQLEAEGNEVLVFHATGAGGKTMEALANEGLIDAVLDITTTEWADELCGGVFSAGPTRLTAAGAKGLPQLIAPGCVDMVNFGPLKTVPEKYIQDKRLLEVWNPSVTLMRTNQQENEQLGKIFAEKANAAKGPVAFLLPLRGLSILGAESGPFYNPEADTACFNAIKSNVRDDISVIEIDNNINDPEFSAQAVAILEELMAQPLGVISR